MLIIAKLCARSIKCCARMYQNKAHRKTVVAGMFVGIKLSWLMLYTVPYRTLNLILTVTPLTQSNKMLINYSKTKEMILGIAKSNPPPTLLIEGKKIERVSSFKLLGVHISDDFRWESHINAVCSKVSSRLYFLKQLKRAGVSSDDLLYFYTVVIRPVFEYACVVWHHNLTASQSDNLDSLQKRALRIIHGDFAVGKSYEFLISFSKIELCLKEEQPYARLSSIKCATSPTI